MTKYAWSFVFAIVFVAGCGGDGGTSTPAGDPDAVLQNGTYNVSESATSSIPDCSGTDNYNVDVTISGNTVTVTAPNGRSYVGTRSGGQISSSGFSFPEDGGTTTVNPFTIVVESATRLTATSSWTWSDGSLSCSGTTSSVITYVGP